VNNTRITKGAKPAVKSRGLPVDPKRAEFLVRADVARKMARYSGPVDSRTLAAATRTMVAWRKLTETMIGKRR
jgi:hypothetical protein